MTFPRTIHTNVTPDTPTFVVRLNGKDINPEYQVMSVVVTRAVNRISMADILLYDGDPSEEDFKISSSSDFIPGAEVEVQFGYHSQNKTVFKGIITHHSIKINPGRPSVLRITCRDKAVKMTVGRKNAYFHKKKDSDIIKSLISQNGLQASVEGTKVTHPEMVQYYATDWDFVLSRAEANGLLVFTEDGKVSVKKPQLGNPAVSALYGATILSFEAEMDARYQYGGVEATSWDSAKQKIVSVKGTKPSNLSPGDQTSDKLSQTLGIKKYPVMHGGQLKDVELQEWANAQFQKSQLAKIRGRVRFQGYDKIKPGDTIELGGLGKRFNGKAYVSGVRHEFDNMNWETDVSFGMDPNWFHEQFDNIVSTPASGLLPAIHGLTIGIVTKLEKDPDGEDRVRVIIPTIDPTGEGLWARVACLDAGKERGSFFRPEINDEVVLGFLNDDPRNPVILGQLHSSKNPAPVKVKDTNHEKGFYTRAKMKLVFNDEDKSITMETPGGQSLVIDDKAGSIVIKDKNGNTLTLDKAGITLESAKDVILKAGANLKAESSANMELKGGAQLKATGSAGAELSTSAIATIKGSLVKIN
ncbi:MAG: type VI secretion system tip protein VgrG [Bacteroidia bacterium]|nr:type VI secretion system tip protein VgrG [Bacteroidia bacterium]